MQNGTANTMLKMIVYFQKTKTIVRNKEKNIAIYKSVSSKQKPSRPRCNKVGDGPLNFGVLVT